MQSLPSHRQFLTSLVTTLSSDSAQSPTPITATTEEGQNTTIPQDRRRLLLTLHVLFPTLLLPSLDLLDRRLVTRITTSSSLEEEEKKQLHVVKSLGATLTHRRRDAAASAASRSYIVRLAAWNCSCASFTFDAFPVSVTPVTATDLGGQPDWSFGGMSLDGLAGAGEDVPCCKHLLACLLADRWSGLLGSYVESKEVSKEELAGIIAGL